MKHIKKFNESDEFWSDPNLRVSEDDLYEVESVFREEVLDVIDDIDFAKRSIYDYLGNVVDVPAGRVEYSIYPYDSKHPSNLLVGNRSDKIGICISIAPYSITKVNQIEIYNKCLQNFVDVILSAGWVISGEYTIKKNLIVHTMNRKYFNFRKKS